MGDDGGYLVATVGALLGTVVVGLLGCCVGYVWAEYYVRTYDYSRGSEPFPLPLIILCIAVGLLIGEIIGCWMALRAWDLLNAFVTALLLTALQVLSIGGLILAAIDNDDASFLWMIPFSLLLMPAVARALTNVIVPDV